MDQLNFLSMTPTEEWVFDVLQSSLLCTVRDNNANQDNLLCKTGKNYSSVWFAKQLAFRICCRDDCHYFGVSADFSKSAPPEIMATLTATGKADGFFNFEFTPTVEGITFFSSFLCNVLDQAIDSTPKEFDCCSRYEACSDVKKCINPCPDLAVGCGYRKIMKSGRIFYGANRNV